MDNQQKRQGNVLYKIGHFLPTTDITQKNQVRYPHWTGAKYESLRDSIKFYG